MLEFKTLSKFKSADLESLAAVIGKSKAKIVVEYFEIQNLLSR
jgi:hypothetical protein